MSISFLTPQTIIKDSKRVFVMVQGTEFYIQVLKKEIPELVDSVGGWGRIHISRHGTCLEDAYITVEPS